MRAGELDRLITIEQNTPIIDDYGNPVESWTTLVQVWAKVKPLSGRELFAAQQVTPDAQLKVTIRHRTDLDETMRIIHDGKTYGIEHIAEVGRREGLEILVKLP